MDEKELQALYNAMSKTLDIGGYDQFKAKMQTTDDRKRFYDVVGQNGFDLGNYSEYENRIAGVKKKKIQAFYLKVLPYFQELVAKVVSNYRPMERLR